MSRVIVVYMAPLHVEVDLLSEEVTRVKVQDEAATATGEAFTPTGGPVDPETAARARMLAEGAEWPAWETGS